MSESTKRINTAYNGDRHKRKERECICKRNRLIILERITSKTLLSRRYNEFIS